MNDTTATLPTHYLTVLLGDDLYAIPLGTVKDIRGSAGGQALGGVPDYIVGSLAHALGNMPLVDLRRRIGLPARSGSGPTVTVVLERAGQRFAVRTDAVAEVVDLGIADEPAAITEPDARADLAWLKGAAAAEDRMVLMLDADQLIAPSDRDAVQAAIAEAAAQAA